MAVSKFRFLSVVGTKLRTKVLAVRCAPKFDITIAETERRVAERAAGWAAVYEIPAARDHQIPPPNESKTYGVSVLPPQNLTTNGAENQFPHCYPIQKYADSCKNPAAALPKYCCAAYVFLRSRYGLNLSAAPR
jgi:hypothetical protein